MSEGGHRLHEEEKEKPLTEEGELSPESSLRKRSLFGKDTGLGSGKGVRGTVVMGT